MEFTVVIQKAEEEGFWAEVPMLPGCYSQGERDRPFPPGGGPIIGRVRVSEGVA